jgi:hypothetical protein
LAAFFTTFLPLVAFFLAAFFAFFFAMVLIV